MKKGLIVLLGLLLLGTTAFAAEFKMSFGGGFEFFGNFTTAETQADYGIPLPIPPGTITKSDQIINDLNYGGFLFFDATYAELFVSFYGGSTALYNDNNLYFGGANIGSEAMTFKKSTSSMSIGILAKYPFVFKKVTLAPMAGISYQMFFTGVYGNDFTSRNGLTLDPSDFNTLWAHAGVGVNYAVTEKIYVKAEALYGIKIRANEYDKKNKAYVESFTSGEVMSGWVNAVTARIGIGYKL